ncbi:unnamed protein product [Mytilus coruscus]|uniref:Uncharacterized protein n=1 Tax=Mytilus coruscus TaxID=42192 RepID=A0A6J8CNP5_MYTCO|nr:unnamed protein product [Mytilus coruscus]
MKIPRVIRNVINARIISSYQNYCEKNNLESYRRPTFYRILKVCAASKQKALQGLDNTTSGVMIAIDTLLKLVTKLETFELSKVQVNESVQDDIDFDLNSATKNLLEWKRHLLRTVHQDAARNDILKNLTPNQSLIIMDWAMKFLSVQFRETQSEFFGKKGLSWHMSCSVTRSASSDELDLNCYIHILENGTQGWFSIANILLHLLEQLKCKNQSLEEIYLKSDNAACYHCVNLLSLIQLNNSTFPIRIKEYNFSEAQSEKDLCESKTGSSRLHIYRYANEGHNVLNAGDIKKAVESYGGVKGTNVCVVSIDQASDPKIKSKIPGISVHEPFTGIQTAGKVSYPKTAQHAANEPSAIPEDETTYASDNQNDTQINLIQTWSAAMQSNATSNMIIKGWALKGKRTNIRFSPKVKSYLNEICFNCEKTGKRPNYFALSDELRKSCDENGERSFKIEEWLNPTQIKGYFATLSIELREIEENVEQDEKLYEAVAIIDANTYNENVENFVDEVYTAVNM